MDPLLELCHRVWVLESGDTLGFFEQLGLVARGEVDGVGDERQVDAHSAAVNLIVE